MDFIGFVEEFQNYLKKNNSNIEELQFKDLQDFLQSKKISNFELNLQAICNKDGEIVKFESLSSLNSSDPNVNVNLYKIFSLDFINKVCDSSFETDNEFLQFISSNKKIKAAFATSFLQNTIKELFLNYKEIEKNIKNKPSLVSGNVKKIKENVKYSVNIGQENLTNLMLTTEKLKKELGDEVISFIKDKIEFELLEYPNDILDKKIPISDLSKMSKVELSLNEKNEFYISKNPFNDSFEIDKILTVQNLKTLNELGIKILIDDFTGMKNKINCIENLNNLNVDFHIKIDRELVLRMNLLLEYEKGILDKETASKIFPDFKQFNFSFKLKLEEELNKTMKNFIEIAILSKYKIPTEKMNTLSTLIEEINSNLKDCNYNFKTYSKKFLEQFKNSNFFIDNELKEINKNLIVEFIEDKNVLDNIIRVLGNLNLKAEEIDFQGYHFSKNIPISKLNKSIGLDKGVGVKKLG